MNNIPPSGPSGSNSSQPTSQSDRRSDGRSEGRVERVPYAVGPPSIAHGFFDEVGTPTNSALDINTARASYISSNTSFQGQVPERTSGFVTNPRFNFGYFDEEGGPSAEFRNTLKEGVTSAHLDPKFHHALTGSVLNNVENQRRLMVAVHHLLTNPLVNPLAPEIVDLYCSERRVVENLLHYIRLNPLRTLLLEATLKWVEARDGDGESILQASQDLACLGRLTTFLVCTVKEEAEIQRKINTSSSYGVLQTRASTRASNAFDIKLSAPGAFGLRIFSTHAASELAMLGGWDSYTLGLSAKLVMPPESKGLEAVRSDCCHQCLIAGSAKDCDMNSFGCALCKFLYRTCSYEHLQYENSFKQDIRVKLEDVLPFKGNKKTKTKMKDRASNNFDPKRDHSGDDDNDDQGPKYKKQKRNPKPSFSARNYSGNNGPSCRSQDGDAEMADFPNLMRNFSLEGCVVGSAKALSKQIVPFVPEFLDLTKEDSMAIFPVTPAKRRSNTSRRVPSPKQRDVFELKKLREEQSAKDGDAEDEMDVRKTSSKTPTRATKRSPLLVKKMSFPTHKPKKTFKAQRIIEKRSANNHSAKKGLSFGVTSPKKPPRSIDWSDDESSGTLNMADTLSEIPARVMKTSQDLAKKTRSPIHKIKSKRLSPITSPAKVTISLVKHNGRLSFNLSEKFPSKRSASVLKTDIDDSLPTTIPKDLATPTKLTRTPRLSNTRLKSLNFNVEEVTDELNSMMMSDRCVVNGTGTLRAKNSGIKKTELYLNGINIDGNEGGKLMFAICKQPRKLILRVK